jgi:hypothetical protein
MDPDTAPVLVLAAGALTVVGELSRGERPRPAVFIGTAGAGVLVLLLGTASTQLANGLALVLFLTSLLTSGYDVAQGVARSLKSGGASS